ncbi:hypothetical protein [Caldovatus aquaticus]|uniref:Glycosyltransferase RgtA/B/C/D-like domain-containing protein n=1 Tax=Caldovatus aquaticus TaxID=2865671 RepID=A0ABS7F189_9PROT|nr:hypothetical protein [Caldovatus aquaticus]MBW8268566.1 hypothetical protein [Caldovatus aquaticus]
MQSAIPDEPSPPDREGVRGFRLLGLVLLLAGLALHWRLATGPTGVASDGRLRDTDAYVRTLRIEELRRTGDWYASEIPQLNAPYGLSLHWTRPLDVLILGPALAAERLAGADPRRAIFWSGALSAPALHLAAAFAAAWAAAALWPGSAAWVAALMVLSSPPLLFGYGRAGFTDHHMLILLAGLLGLGAALRAALAPRDRARAAIGAGLAFALGVWVSPEALLVAGPVLAAFGIAWLLAADGAPFARQGLRMAGAMLVGLAVAVISEHPPARWLAGEYDKVSVQHVLMATLAATAFGVAVRLGMLHRTWRLAAGLGLGGASLAILLALYPGALSASVSEADAVFVALLPAINEMMPLAPTREGGLHDLLFWAGGAVAALLVLPAVLALWARDERRWPAGAVLALPFVATCAAALMHRRFAVDLAATSSVAGAGLVWFAERCRGPVRRRIAGWLAIALAVGTPYLALALPRPPQGDAAGLHGSASAALARWLATEGPAGGAPIPDANGPIILTDDLSITPKLAYRTPYRYVGAPYHRGGAAVADTIAMFGAQDEAAARAVLDRRGIAYILVSLPTRPDSILGPLHPESLGARLRRPGAADAPAWLRPLALPPELEGTYRLFAVLR